MPTNKTLFKGEMANTASACKFARALACGVSGIEASDFSLLLDSFWVPNYTTTRINNLPLRPVNPGAWTTIPAAEVKVLVFRCGEDISIKLIRTNTSTWEVTMTFEQARDYTTSSLRQYANGQFLKYVADKYFVGSPTSCL